MCKGPGGPKQNFKVTLHHHILPIVRKFSVGSLRPQTVPGNGTCLHYYPAIYKRTGSQDCNMALTHESHLFLVG